MHYWWNAFALDDTKPTITSKNGDKIMPSDDFTEVIILNPQMPIQDSNNYNIKICMK